MTTFVVKSNPRNGPLGEAYRLIINDYQLPNRPLITQVLAEFSEPSPPRLSATSAVKHPALEKPSPPRLAQRLWCRTSDAIHSSPVTNPIALSTKADSTHRGGLL